MKIAIAGFGVEGRVNYDYWNTPGNEVTIVDEREVIDAPEGARTKLGKGAFDDLGDFDMVVRTAGLSPDKLSENVHMWSATNEFFRQCPAPIIGVTGSKGKGTTCSLITEILRAAGKTVHLVGNIGVPALSVLPSITSQDIVVYELSSFQLWDAERSPHVSVVLHIEADHLDVHKDFAQYLAAKANIVKYQSRSDVCFYHPTNQWSEAIAKVQPDFANQAAKYQAQDNGNSELTSVYVQDDWFVTTRGEKICSVDEVKLLGKHNLDNACAAISASLVYEASNEAIAKGLSTFTGLPHRLKFVAEKQGVKYYDDSIATTPGSAIAAINAFTQPKVAIFGGSYKGADFVELARECADVMMRHIVLIGAEAPRIAEALQDEGAENYTLLQGKTMSEIVKEATNYAEPGDVVILSPACASFGDFKNYADRGDQFITAVNEL